MSSPAGLVRVCPRADELEPEQGVWWSLFSEIAKAAGPRPQLCSARCWLPPVSAIFDLADLLFELPYLDVLRLACGCRLLPRFGKWYLAFGLVSLVVDLVLCHVSFGCLPSFGVVLCVSGAWIGIVACRCPEAGLHLFIFCVRWLGQGYHF